MKNASTGLFTVPSSGRFSVTSRVIYATLYKNGSYIIRDSTGTLDITGVGGQLQRTSAILGGRFLQLTAGDQLCVGVFFGTASTGTQQLRNCYFNAQKLASNTNLT
jgi:hypothetical protein